MFRGIIPGKPLKIRHWPMAGPTITAIGSSRISVDADPRSDWYRLESAALGWKGAAHSAEAPPCRADDHGPHLRRLTTVELPSRSSAPATAKRMESLPVLAGPRNPEVRRVAVRGFRSLSSGAPVCSIKIEWRQVSPAMRSACVRWRRPDLRRSSAAQVPGRSYFIIMHVQGARSGLLAQRSTRTAPGAAVPQTGSIQLGQLGARWCPEPRSAAAQTADIRRW